MRAPAKAAITMTKDETASTYWINTIIVIATMSFDPEEIPRVKGLAIGLPKNTCIRNPDSARPPPRIADVIISRQSYLPYYAVCGIITFSEQDYPEYLFYRYMYAA